MGRIPASTSPAADAGVLDRIWIRNDVGRVWGPFSLDAIDRIDLGHVDTTNRIQVSPDGSTFHPLATFPKVRLLIERSFQRRRSAREATAESAPAATEDVPEAQVVPEPDVVEPTSVVQIYTRIASDQLTGRLTLETAEGPYVIHFRRGTPERIQSPRHEEDLVRFLTDRRIASAAEVASAVEISGGAHADMADALLALGDSAEGRPRALMIELGVELLIRALEVEVGSFLWADGTPPPAESVPLGHRWELLRQWSRLLPRAVVRRRLGDRTVRAVSRSAGARATLKELRLTPEEHRLVGTFDGSQSIAQIAHAVPDDADAIFRLCLVLAEVGHLSFGEELQTNSAVDLAAPVLEKVTALKDRSGADEVDGPVVARVALRSTVVPAARGPSSRSGSHNGPSSRSGSHNGPSSRSGSHNGPPSNSGSRKKNKARSRQA